VNRENLTTSNKIKTMPDLLRKEALAAIASLALVSFVSAVWDAPISGPVVPGGIPPAQVKAPWIFVGIQQMLRYLPAFAAGVLLPVAALATLGIIPWMSGPWRKVGAALFFGIVLAFFVLTVWGYFR
jgi:Cytochrome b(C-terminal)/b6/petD